MMHRSSIDLHGIFFSFSIDPIPKISLCIVEFLNYPSSWHSQSTPLQVPKIRLVKESPSKCEHDHQYISSKRANTCISVQASVNTIVNTELKKLMNMLGLLSPSWWMGGTTTPNRWARPAGQPDNDLFVSTLIWPCTQWGHWNFLKYEYNERKIINLAYLELWISSFPMYKH